MQSFDEALEKGFKIKKIDNCVYHQLEFGDGYKLCFEPLIWDDQYYVALYKDKELLTGKVVVKPGK